MAQSSPAACTAGAHEGRAQCAKQAVVSPMSKGVLQAVGAAGRPLRIVGAIAADEPSEAGSTASELANIGGPKG